MGNQVGGRRRRRPAVEERYTRPQGLYPHPDIDLKKLRRLILEAKLAPCYPGSDDHRADLEECPICFLFYPSLNRSKCCAKGICTECFLQMRTPTSCRPTQCPYCKMSSYAVEYRGVKTKEEKGNEQIEEQRVIEAQIRMRQQELQDDAERMKKKQTDALTNAVTTVQVEHCDTGGASTIVESSGPDNDMLSSQVHHAELLLKTSERLKQLRNNNLDMDLEEVMLVEALWLSMQDQDALENPTCANAVSPILPPRSFDGSITIPAEAASSSNGFACAVAALAEQQQMYGETSSTATCHSSRCDILSRSDRSFTEDLTVNGSGSSGTRSEEPSSTRARQARDGAEYSNERWSELAEASSSFNGSDLTIEAGAANSGGSDIGSGGIPDTFEEQMMLAMALSLADSRAKASSPGLTWR
ncbi:E3 ubiquitin-protein ligase GW2-like [Oryza brachyantha]|uniref:E3 ubiquitin-protein ligase GW2-like n=1 Tax=Oryza brachyantha TaxID=4533 RepID=UPI001ADC2C29|nr:E3 ubiquitin-protein ligase GW2-like [Oryza brachyantha]